MFEVYRQEKQLPFNRRILYKEATYEIAFQKMRQYILSQGNFIPLESGVYFNLRKDKVVEEYKAFKQKVKWFSFGAEYDRCQRELVAEYGVVEIKTNSPKSIQDAIVKPIQDTIVKPIQNTGEPERITEKKETLINEGAIKTEEAVKNEIVAAPKKEEIIPELNRSNSLQRKPTNKLPLYYTLDDIKELYTKHFIDNRDEVAPLLIGRSLAKLNSTEKHALLLWCEDKCYRNDILNLIGRIYEICYNNMKSALYYYNSAAEKGNGHAMYSLYTHYSKENAVREKIEWLQKSATAGYIKAICELELYYRRIVDDTSGMLEMAEHDVKKWEADLVTIKKYIDSAKTTISYYKGKVTENEVQVKYWYSRRFNGSQ